MYARSNERPRHLHPLATTITIRTHSMRGRLTTEAFALSEVEVSKPGVVICRHMQTEIGLGAGERGKGVVGEGMSARMGRGGRGSVGKLF